MHLLSFHFIFSPSPFALALVHSRSHWLSPPRMLPTWLTFTYLTTAGSPPPSDSNGLGSSTIQRALPGPHSNNPTRFSRIIGLGRDDAKHIQESHALTKPARGRRIPWNPTEEVGKPPRKSRT
ncbi:hypothetical protein H4582DRAFT_2058845 [Lactarius indigo]|nr:hypothetical protein H4582DRAFT_2065542 [Lactarius indigo]KAI9436498.1 hypothetical protein H4582DRAFT_2058845 [Lactarius indigo]